MTWILVSVTLLSILNCASPFLVGGRNCDIGQYPFLVSILSLKNSTILTRCGGSLVTFQWTLTAAHCLLQEIIKRRNVLVAAGSSYMTERVGNVIEIPYGNASQVKFAKEGICHPKYDDTNPFDMRYDLGLVKTEEPFVQFPGFVGLAKLPRKNDFTEECSYGSVLGWGNVGIQREKREPRHLTCVKLPIISLQECQKHYPDPIYLLDHTVICTMEKKGGKDACFGESGGPLVCNGTVIGLVSAGRGCGLPNRAATFTKVDTFWMFIGNFTGIEMPKNMKSWKASGCERNFLGFCFVLSLINLFNLL